MSRMRNIVVVLSSALILVGCTAQTPTPTPNPTESSASSASPSSAPTEAPATGTPDVETVAPYDGDCTQLLSEERAAQLGIVLHKNEAESSPQLGWEPFYSDSMQRIGAFGCGWEKADGTFAASLFVIPSAAVGAQVREKWSDLMEADCDPQVGPCSLFVESNGLLAEIDAYSDDLEAALVAALSAPTEAVIGSLPDDAWQTLLTCDDIDVIVQQSAASAALTPGAPTDATSFGPLADGLRETAPYLWCPMNDAADGTSIVVAVQPGVGAPTATRLTALASSPVTISGATEAWEVQGMLSATTVAVVAVVGSNRVTVSAGSITRSDEELLATATTIATDLLAQHAD